MKATSAPLQNKTTSAESAGRVGMVELKTWFMASTNGLETSQILQGAGEAKERTPKAASRQAREPSSRQAHKRAS